MKRHAPPRGIKPVMAPFAVENEYRIEMDTLIRAMAQDIHREVMAIYRPWLEMQRAAIVGDASVVDLLVAAFNRLRAKWGRRATPMAEKRAPIFVSKVNDTVSLSFTRMLRSVSVDPKDVPKANRLQGKAMEVTLDAAVAENVALIKSIPTEYIDSVQRDVLLAVQGGWPLGQLSDMLKKRYGITRRRAELIARDQCAKVTGRMNQQRSLAAGFTEADWWHSAGSRYPRKLHMKANGKRFKLAEGCEIGGEHILCGQKINCFPGDTLVNLSQGCHVVWRYKYRGKINTFNTGRGIIRATPNHPILTSRGWVPINAIEAGDYVWKARSEIIHSCMGNQNNTHTSFENLFESLRLKGGSTLRNGAAFDFHGDIPDDEVETVRVEHNLGLEGNIQFLKEACKLHLTNTNASIGSEDVSRANVLEPSFSGASGDVNPFHFAHAAHADVSGFTSSARLNPHSLKSINHKNAAAVDCFADGENANFSLIHIGDDFISISRSSGVTKVSLCGGGIITDEVLSKFVSTYPEMAGEGFYCGETFFERLRVSDEIGCEDYSGHVYTLQSYSGYYMASTENIATKNCKCFFTVVVPGRS